MIRLTLRELLDLVASDNASPEARVEKIFEWAHARRLEMVKWLLTLAAALFVPVAVAAVRGELIATASPWWAIAAVFGSTCLAVLGLVMLIRARRIHHTYIAAQTLLGTMKRIAPLLRRFRGGE